MNRLPNELILFIFEYLNTKDLIQCSMVCKRFKLLCQDAKITELIISKSTENVKDFWFYTNKQFNFQDAIDVITFNSYRSIFRLDKFKRLYFEGCQSEYAQLQVNDLTQLEQIKIDVRGGDCGEHGDIHINLDNLKIVEIITNNPHTPINHKFLITTPKLEVLECPDFNAIYVTHPDTVTYLETISYRESFHVLKNLQSLLVEYTGEFNWSNTLSAFPKLTTFSCNCSYDLEAIENLVKFKREHQRPELKIYFLSVELDDVDKIDEYNYHRDEFLFQVNNYKALAETISTVSKNHRIDYDQLMHSMKGKIPKDFSKKFFSTQSISVSQNVENQDHLFGFLKQFEYLTTLDIGSESLDQSFYDRLDAFDQLTSLSIEFAKLNSCAWSFRKSYFNFDAVLRLKNLRYFSTDVDSVRYFDLALKLFSQPKDFRSMGFDLEEEYVYMKKNEKSNEYTISYCRNEKTQLDFAGLVCEVNAMKNQHLVKYQSQ